MSLGKVHGNTFPFYLVPGPDIAALKWIGDHLKKIRGNKSDQIVADKAGVSGDMINALENGNFHINLGQLREIIHRGYGVEFTEVLEACYKANRAHFDPKQKRPFLRDYHYSVCTRKDENDKLPPSLLIGGDPENFLWAVPMRSLKKQPMMTELLELRTARSKKRRGIIDENSHDGSEVIFVIHGSITVGVAPGEGESVNTRELKAGDYIHFHARQVHSIQNADKNSTALLLVVRLPSVR